MMLFCTVVILTFVANSSSYILNTRISRSLAVSAVEANDFDPNFASHLPTLLKKGSVEDRPSPDLATKLRERYQKISAVKRMASKTIGSVNPELAVELEELAQEIEETTETFINLATQWDAWNRPSPDLAKELRANKSVQSPDPNFEAHLKDIYRKGRAEDRASPDLPSELRMMKYKNMANVQKLAAKILKEVNPELAIEMGEIADEINESHDLFEQKAQAIKDKKYN